MKKLFLFLVPVLFAGFFSACDNEDEVKSIEFHFGNQKVSSVTVTNIGVTSIEVRNAIGTYTVKSIDKEIATAGLNEYGIIYIKGRGNGTTSVIVTDSENRTATLSVEVVDEELSFQITDHEVLVEAEGDQPVDEIEAQIEAQLHPIGGVFRLVYTSDREGAFTFYPDITQQENKTEGTFAYTPRGNEHPAPFFTFNYNNEEVVYTIILSNVSITEKSTSDLMPKYTYFVRDFLGDYSQTGDLKITKAIGALIISPFSF